jgi:hypothetical protein
MSYLYMPDEFRSHFRLQEKHLKTFVRELQIVQHLENQLVQHYISYESCTYLLVVYRLVLMFLLQSEITSKFIGHI